MSKTNFSKISAKHRISSILLLYFGVLLVSFPENFVRPFIKQFSASLETSAILTGVVLSIHSLSYAVLSPLGGLWSDKLGKRKPFIIGIAILAASYICAYYAADITLLMFARALTGVGTALVSVTLIAQLAGSFSIPHRGTGFSFYMNITAIAMIIAPFIGGVISEADGYRPLFLISIVFVLATLFLIPVLTAKGVSEKTMDDPKKANIAKIGIKVVLNRNILAIAIELFGIGIGWIAYLMYTIQALGQQVLALSNIQIGTIVSLIGITHCVSSLLSGPLSDIIHRRKLFVFIGIFLAGATVMALPLVKSFYDFAIISALWGFMIGIQCPIGLAFIADSTESSFFGSAMGFVSGVETFGMLLGPLMCAIVESSFGVGTVYLVPALGLMVSGLVFILFAKEPQA